MENTLKQSLNRVAAQILCWGFNIALSSNLTIDENIFHSNSFLLLVRVRNKSQMKKGMFLNKLSLWDKIKKSLL